MTVVSQAISDSIEVLRAAGYTVEPPFPLSDGDFVQAVSGYGGGHPIHWIGRIVSMTPNGLMGESERLYFVGVNHCSGQTKVEASEILDSDWRYEILGCPELPGYDDVKP